MFEYTWEMFRCALDEEDRQRMRQLADTAVAFRVAMYADKEQFAMFINRQEAS